ncbi:MAG: TM0106 family RecB-like putative nuclease [Candidatus Sericytochromatia bacterium]
MKLGPADLYTYFKPSRCQRRVYLIHHVPEGLDIPAGTQYYGHAQEADRHVERYYYKRLERPLDLSELSPNERRKATMEAILRQEPVIYKPLLVSSWQRKGKRVTLEATPDFLIWGEGGYRMRHCRMAKKISRENHPDIFWIAQYHAWVFQRLFGHPPAAIEVGNSEGQILQLDYPSRGSVEKLLEHLLFLRRSPDLPYHPVSWTKCQSCDFRSYCWQEAESIQDIALIPTLEASLILDLRSAGILTVPQLLEHHTPESLAAFEWTEGQNTRPIGLSKARTMLYMAESLLTQKPILTRRPDLPDTRHWIMFDLEGVPARPGQPEKVYLWGMYLMGDNSENLQLINQTPNRQADRDNWFAFLAQAQEVFERYGDVPFVHWGSFEPYCIKLYSQRFGDRNGVAKRVQRNLLDFFSLLKDAVIIPLPSYSLKVIEKYVGFERPDQDTGGYWSVVNYLKAVSTKNAERREQILEQLMGYNLSDLLAMWHVVRWLQDLIENQEVA